jgi:hypothetical protein
LEKDPAKRPTTASEARRALAAIEQSSHRPSEQPGDAPRSEASPASPLYRQVFVGREAELHQLQSTFDSALSGQGALAMVVGEPGIGKTALCEQLSTYVAVRGGKTLVGHSYEEGSLSLPYLPFVEALRSYVLVQEPDRLKQELGSGAAEVARIISEIRDRVSVELRPAGDPEDDRWRLFQAITGFLRNAASVHPILLVLEDLHWADHGTLDFLVHLSRNLAASRLLVVGTYRDVEVDRSHPLSATLAELRRSASFHRVPLRGLTVDEVNRMMNAIRGQEVPWSRAEAIHRQTEGNPLFVQEVLRYLVEEGLVVREGGQYVRTDGGQPDSGIPEGLRDVIGKRLSHLSTECNRLLTVAAVIGREFSLDVLALVARPSSSSGQALDEEELVASLEEALKVGVLEEQARVGGVLYRFAHALFRQTLYEELSAARRIRLHQEVGRALEQVHARRLDDHAPELAEHFSHSSDAADLAKAVDYGARGAHRAASVYAYGESVRLLERAIEVQEVLDPDDKSRRCDLLLALAEALMGSGEPQRVAETVVPQTFTLAEDLGDQTRASTSCRLALNALERYGGASVWASEPYRRWAERADRYAATGSIDRIQAEVALDNAFINPFVGGQPSRPHAARAIALARELGTPRALFLGAQPALQPNSPVGEDERYRAAQELATCGRQGVELFTLARGLYFSGVALFNHGDREGAEALWHELEELGTRTRDTYVLLRGPFLATVRATLDGQLEEALEAAQVLSERAHELGSAAFGNLWGTALRLRPSLYLGRADALLPDLETGLTGPAFTTARGVRQALCLAYLGRSADAERVLADLQAFSSNAPTEREQAVMAMEAAALIGDKPHCAELIGRILPVMPSDLIGNPEHSCTSVGRVLGMAAVLAGDRDTAEGYYRQALSSSERARFRPEVALIRLQLADLLLSEQRSAIGGTPGKAQDEGREHLDFAIKEFEGMKMQPSLDRALRLKQ